MPTVSPLRDALLAHTPADPTEAAHQAAMLALCDTEAPFSRAQFAPGHFTASAFILSPDGTSLLLIFHEKLHRWLQPGGHIEPEDLDVYAAVLREVAEETGIHDATPVGAAPFDLDVHVIPARKADPEHRHFDVRVLLRAPSLDVTAATDALAAKWVPLDQVHTVETDDSVLRAVRKLRA